MSQYNPHFHHRRSIRLKGYDYSRAGLYFITICVQDRACLFGGTVRGTVGASTQGYPYGSPSIILNDAGNMVERWYYELENKYPDKRCHEMVVMPNHFHCIIENAPESKMEMEMGAHVGAPRRGRPIDDDRPHNDDCPNNNEHFINETCNQNQYGPDNKKYNATIGEAMDWFKTMTTNEYIRGVKTLGWQPFNGKLWQRNYWEHIIRNEQSYQRISEYIKNNPAKWKDDKFFES